MLQVQYSQIFRVDKPEKFSPPTKVLKNKFSSTFLRFSFITRQSQNCNKDTTFNVNNEKLQFFFTVLLHFLLFQVFTKATFVEVWNYTLILKRVKSSWKLCKGIKVQALLHIPAQVTLQTKIQLSLLDTIWTQKVKPNPGIWFCSINFTQKFLGKKFGL